MGADADLHKPIGEDKYGWAFTGDGSLIHNGKRQRGFGPIAASAAFTMIMDKTNGALVLDLWGAVDGKSIVHAYKNLQGLSLYPAFSFGKPGQKVHAAVPHDFA